MDGIDDEGDGRGVDVVGVMLLDGWLWMGRSRFVVCGYYDTEVEVARLSHVARR